MTLHNRELLFLKEKIKSFQIKNGENVEKIVQISDPVANFNTKQEFLNVLVILQIF